jgi:hypothetical protein
LSGLAAAGIEASMRSILRLVPFALVLTALPAAASEPSSIYTVPTEVEILPDEASGTRVVIAGSFFFLTTPMGFTYGEPQCGYMSFQCPPGKEVMCRMQWQDIRKIGPSFCAGFGTLGMLSAAHVHADRASLGTPDPWDLGLGISTGQYVDGKCPKALALACALAAPDAGVADAAVVESTDVGSSRDLALVDAPPGPDSAVPAADAAFAPTPAKPSGCAFGGTGGGASSLLVLLAWLRRARRR